MKNLVCILIFIFLIIGCSTTTDNSTIYRAIDRHHNKMKADSCQINLMEITTFSWDYFYFFNYSATPEEIDTILGLAYGSYEEFSDKYFFVKDNKVIVYESVSLKFKGIDPAGGGSLVHFPNDYDKNYILIDKTNYKFTVTKEINRFNEKCYNLEKVKNEN